MSRFRQRFFDIYRIAESQFDRMLVLVLMLLGVLYAGWQAMQQDWLELAVSALGVAILFVLAAFRLAQQKILGQPLNRRHLTYILLFSVYALTWINLIRPLMLMETTGKNSAIFYSLLMMVVAVTLMIARALFMLTPFGYAMYVTRLPLWEQILIAINEFIAAGLLAFFVGSSVLPRLLQPSIFTTRIDPTYMVGVSLLLVIYYMGMQVMWIQGWNDWISQNHVWVRLARLLAPLALAVVSMMIWRRFIERTEPRTADLLGDSQVDLAILSLGAVVWLVILVLNFLVYTSGRGLRQRFLPDLLLERLPMGFARLLRSISDMDLLLIIGLFSTLIPTYLLLLGDRGGFIGTLREQILQRGSALIETSEQALAVLFALPFYLLAVALMLLYAYIFSRASLSAHDRDELVRQLPIGFLIVLIITLYLFAVPFSQVLTEGRLPQLPQDLGRILLFNILIPLLMLYAHYFLLVRWPYSRGQKRWRELQNTGLARQQADTERRIETLNREIENLDQTWQTQPAPESARLDTLYRYVQLNSLRDDLNMQRLQVIGARQQLAELSEAPISIAVARLPLRVVSLGIPLLIAIQVYQWAIVNNGLREVINNPNITVDEFFRIILQQINF